MLTTSKLVAELDILLTLEQFKLAVPDTLACYVSYGTGIMFETITLPVSDITGICQGPLSLLRWDPLSFSLVQVPQEV